MRQNQEAFTRKCAVWYDLKKYLTNIVGPKFINFSLEDSLRIYLFNKKRNLFSNPKYETKGNPKFNVYCVGSEV